MRFWEDYAITYLIHKKLVEEKLEAENVLIQLNDPTLPPDVYDQAREDIRFIAQNHTIKLCHEVKLNTYLPRKGNIEKRSIFNFENRFEIFGEVTELEGPDMPSSILHRELQAEKVLHKFYKTFVPVDTISLLSYQAVRVTVVCAAPLLFDQHITIRVDTDKLREFQEMHDDSPFMFFIYSILKAEIESQWTVEIQNI